MNSDRLEGDWNQLKGKAKNRWGKLTDDQLTQSEGSVDKLLGHIQEAYGIAKDEAMKQVDEWKSGLGRAMTDAGIASGPSDDPAAMASEAARRFADDARGMAQQRADQLAEEVRNKPLGTLAAAFGVGLLIGLIIGR